MERDEVVVADYTVLHHVVEGFKHACNSTVHCDSACR